MLAAVDTPRTFSGRTPNQAVGNTGVTTPSTTPHRPLQRVELGEAATTRLAVLYGDYKDGNNKNNGLTGALLGDTKAVVEELQTALNASTGEATFVIQGIELSRGELEERLRTLNEEIQAFERQAINHVNPRAGGSGWAFAHQTAHNRAADVNGTRFYTTIYNELPKSFNDTIDARPEIRRYLENEFQKIKGLQALGAQNPESFSNLTLAHVALRDRHRQTGRPSNFNHKTVPQLLAATWEYVKTDENLKPALIEALAELAQNSLTAQLQKILTKAQHNTPNGPNCTDVELNNIDNSIRAGIQRIENLNPPTFTGQQRNTAFREALANDPYRLTDELVNQAEEFLNDVVAYKNSRRQHNAASDTGLEVNERKIIQSALESLVNRPDELIELIGSLKENENSSQAAIDTKFRDLKTSIRDGKIALTALKLLDSQSIPITDPTYDCYPIICTEGWGNRIADKVYVPEMLTAEGVRRPAKPSPNDLSARADSMVQQTIQTFQPADANWTIVSRETRDSLNERLEAHIWLEHGFFGGLSNRCCTRLIEDGQQKLNDALDRLQPTNFLVRPPIENLTPSRGLKRSRSAEQLATRPSIRIAPTVTNAPAPATNAPPVLQKTLNETAYEDLSIRFQLGGLGAPASPQDAGVLTTLDEAERDNGKSLEVRAQAAYFGAYVMATRAADGAAAQANFPNRSQVDFARASVNHTLEDILQKALNDANYAPTSADYQALVPRLRLLGESENDGANINFAGASFTKEQLRDALNQLTLPQGPDATARLANQTEFNNVISDVRQEKAQRALAVMRELAGDTKELTTQVIFREAMGWVRHQIELEEQKANRLPETINRLNSVRNNTSDFLRGLEGGFRDDIALIWKFVSAQSPSRQDKLKSALLNRWADIVDFERNESVERLDFVKVEHPIAHLVNAMLDSDALHLPSEVPANNSLVQALNQQIENKRELVAIKANVPGWVARAQDAVALLNAMLVRAGEFRDTEAANAAQQAKRAGDAQTQLTEVNVALNSLQMLAGDQGNAPLAGFAPTVLDLMRQALQAQEEIVNQKVADATREQEAANNANARAEQAQTLVDQIKGYAVAAGQHATAAATAAATASAATALNEARNAETTATNHANLAQTQANAARTALEDVGITMDAQRGLTPTQSPDLRFGAQDQVDTTLRQAETKDIPPLKRADSLRSVISDSDDPSDTTQQFQFPTGGGDGDGKADSVPTSPTGNTTQPTSPKLVNAANPGSPPANVTATGTATPGGNDDKNTNLPLRNTNTNPNGVVAPGELALRPINTGVTPSGQQNGSPSNVNRTTNQNDAQRGSPPAQSPDSRFGAQGQVDTTPRSSIASSGDGGVFEDESEESIGSDFASIRSLNSALSRFSLGTPTSSQSDDDATGLDNAANQGNLTTVPKPSGQQNGSPSNANRATTTQTDNAIGTTPTQPAAPAIPPKQEIENLAQRIGTETSATKRRTLSNRLTELLKQQANEPKPSPALLHIAIKHEVNDVAATLIDKLPLSDLNAPDANGQTPLHLAAKLKRTEVTDALIKKKVDINVGDKEGLTPLHIAAQEGSDAVTELLVKAPGINVNAEDTQGYAPLHHAAKKNHAKVIEKLAEKDGLDLNKNLTLDSKPISAPFVLAVKEGNHDAAKALMKLGVDLTQKDNATSPSAKRPHRTALSIAMDDPRMRADLLKYRAADVMKAGLHKARKAFTENRKRFLGF